MKVTPSKILADYLIGKKLKHKNTHRREVSLEVESVNREHHHIQITEDTPQNDWWGESKDWDTIKIGFVDGSSIEVSLNSDLEIE